MDKLTLEDFKIAIGKLAESDFTKDGAPKMAALNTVLVEAGFPVISLEERDEMLASILEEGAETDFEDPDPDVIEVTITHAQCDPIPLYVHGVGKFQLRIGETRKLPADAVEALRNTDVKFTITETDNG